MSEPAFPAHITRALDQLTVPPVPAGFGDRILARISADDLPEVTGEADIALPALRRTMSASGWRRSARIVVVAAAFGLATATAAASGVFGDPVYIPVVSQALARAKIVEMPQEKPTVDKVAETHKPDIIANDKKTAPEPKGKDAVITAIATLRADPDFHSLPRVQRQERLKAEITKLIADGKLQKGDVKAAWAQLATERKAADNARLEQGLPVPKRRMVETKQRAEPLTPEQKEKVRDAIKQLTEAQRAELQVLRQRRRKATLHDRRAIHDEIRAFWQRVGVKPTAEQTSSETP